MQKADTVCPLDCPDRCSLEVDIEDGRVTALRGNHVNPVTAGYICAKVRRFPERVYGADRLLHPMRRSGPKGSGQFERITWDEALDSIARRLHDIRRTHGGEAILPYYYGGSNGMISQGTSDERFFRRIGSRRLAPTICATPTTAAARALYAGMASVDYPDFASARFIILWGANPKHTHIHLLPYIKAAREAGARVAFIDPRRVMDRPWVDMHLPVYPGSDGAVALAMIAHLDRIGKVDRGFLEQHTTGSEKLLERAREWTLERAADRARVPARDIAAIAEAYAAADPALVRCGWGLERNRNGESAVAAVLALPAIAGKFGRVGGGYTLSTSAVYAVDDDRIVGVPEQKTRIVNMVRVGRALAAEASPPVKALFVYNSNLLATTPDQNRVRRGLEREDLFTIVFEQVMTDTARYADILLPATTFLEHAEVNTSYGNYLVMLGEPIIPPVGESRSNEEVFRLLMERMGIEEGAPTGDALLAATLDGIDGPIAGENGGATSRGAPDGGRGAARLDRLRREKILKIGFEGGRPVQFANVFPDAPDRRAHLWPETLGPDPYLVRDDPGKNGDQLALISPATDRSISSTLGEFNFKQVHLEMHPEDAAARGLSAGDRVRVHNDLGEVLVPLRINPGIRPGVVYLPKGIWNKHTENGVVSNAVIPDTVTEISGGACFNDARVAVSRAD